jgi:hypothetical protein
MTDLDKRAWWRALDPTWKRLFKLALDINHTPSDEELTAILELEAIDCSNSRIISVDPLQHLTRLRKLTCRNTRLRSIEKLRPLQLLDEVDISRTDIISLEPLEECAGLWSLKCAQMPVEFLTGLADLRELAYLDCSETKVTSLSPLLGSRKLRQVDCHLSQVSDAAAVEQLTAAGVEVIYNDTPIEYAEIKARLDKEAEEAEALELLNTDSMFEEAARVIVTHQQGSTSLLQRRLKLGYNRAGRLINQLEHAGIVGPFNGAKARAVLIPDEYSLEQLLNSLSSNEQKTVHSSAPPAKDIYEARPVVLHDSLVKNDFSAPVAPLVLTRLSNQPAPVPKVEPFVPPVVLPLPEPQPSAPSQIITPPKKSIWSQVAEVIKLITG